MKKHRYLFVSFFLFIIGYLNAQTRLQGHVKDAKGVAIENAKVYLMSKTEASGAYIIEQGTEKKTLADGSFNLVYTGKDPLLTVEVLGFERKKVKITEGEIEVILQPLTTVEKNKNGIKNEIITVNGVCGMCKKRIEMATYAVSGVKSAVWSAEKQALTVSFEASKTDLETIKKKVASIGHDAPPFAAEKKVYDKLPPCCKYRDGIGLH